MQIFLNLASDFKLDHQTLTNQKLKHFKICVSLALCNFQTISESKSNAFLPDAIRSIAAISEKRSFIHRKQ